MIKKYLYVLILLIFSLNNLKLKSEIPLLENNILYKYPYDNHYTIKEAWPEAKCDSIYRTITKTDTIERIIRLNDLSPYYVQYSINKSLKYAEEALKLSKIIKFTEGQVYSLQNLVFYYTMIGNHKMTRLKSNELLPLVEKSADSLLKAGSYSSIGIAYLDYGSPSLAFDYFYHSLTIFERNHDSYGCAIAYYNLGKAFYRLENYKEALNYFQLAQSELKKINNYYEIANINLILARVHIYMDNWNTGINILRKLLYNPNLHNPSRNIYACRETARYFLDFKNNYDSSMHYLNQSLILAHKYKYNHHLGLSYTFLAYLNSVKNDKEEALSNNLKALKYREKYGNSYLISSSHLNIGSLYLEMNDYDNSLRHLKKGLKIAKKISSIRYKAFGYKALYKYFKQRKKFTKALENYKNYAAIRDSMDKNFNNKNIMILKYEYEKKQENREKEILIKKNKINDLKLSRQTLNMKFLIITLIMLFVLAVVMYIRFRHKKKSVQALRKTNEKLAQSEESLKETNAAKDKFFSITAHDLKNPLYYFRIAFDLLTKSFDFYTKEDRSKLLQDMRKSTDNLYNLLENLLLWSRIQTGSIELIIERFQLKFIIDKIVSEHNIISSNKNIKIINLIDEDINVEGAPVYISIVVRNLISNALKFSNAGTEITIESSDEEDFISVAFKDEGIGMTRVEIDNLFKIDYRYNKLGTMDEKGTGLGLIVSKELVELHGGSIWVESNIQSGSIFSILLPKLNGK